MQKTIDTYPWNFIDGKASNISLDFPCFWLPEYAAGYIIVKQNALLSSVALMNQSTRIRQSCDYFSSIFDWLGKVLQYSFQAHIV